MKKSCLVLASVTAILLALGPNGQADPSPTPTRAPSPGLEERVSELELQNALNKVHFSGTFINRFESLYNKHGLPGADKQLEILQPFGMYFGLNVDFDATKNLKFYSTLAMSKFFNNEGRAESLSPSNYAVYQASEMGAWAYGGATPKFDRAYASYDFDRVPLTLAIGRMPTNGGPPLNQMDGLPREGTYPRFAFNAIFDGIAAVYNFSGLLPKDHTFKVRAFFQPFVNIDSGDRTKQYIDGNRVLSLVPQTAILNEYSIKNLPIAEQFQFMYMYTWWHGFYTGYSGTPAPLGSPPVGQTEDGLNHAFYVGLENIAKIGVNVSWTGLLYKATDSGTPDLHKSSMNHLLNLNYKMGFLRNSIIGYEYIRTTPYFYLDEWTRLNLIPFYSLQNAWGHHLYVTVPLENKIIARIGYYRLNAGAGDVFQPEETSAYSWYAQLRFDF